MNIPYTEEEAKVLYAADFDQDMPYSFGKSKEHATQCDHSPPPGPRQPGRVCCGEVWSLTVDKTDLGFEVDMWLDARDQHSPTKVTTRTLEEALKVFTAEWDAL